MNKEDKKIIDKLKQTIDFNSTLYIDDLGDNDIKDILNLLDNQQKEIERLNFENHMIKKWNEQLDKECISKDKIREKIKDYNKWIKECTESAYIESLEAQKYALNELLEED